MENSSYNREATATGTGVTVAGAGAYAASTRDHGQPTHYTSTNPEVVNSGSNMQPSHVPGAFPTEGGADPAIAATGSRQGYTPVERERYYGQPPSSSGPTYSQYPASSTIPSQQEEQRYGRDAAIAGGTAAGTGTVGYGAYEATRDRDTTTTGPHTSNVANVVDPRVTQTSPRQGEQVGSQYSRDTAPVGASTATTGPVGATTTYPATTTTGAGVGHTVASSDDNRVHADSSGHNYLHKKSVEEPGEKKQGFFSKAFLGHRKEEEVAIGNSSPATEVRRTEAQPTEVQRSPSAVEGLTEPTPGLPHDDTGMITLQKVGSDPDAPALVIREKPGGGIETVPEETR